ncbi:MAG TPA: cytochrome c peroxidase, partial [Chitinophagaceae bacterium]|nr:cytochrome c peroxidase [Chitinophagaceae bacterium]
QQSLGIVAPAIHAVNLERASFLEEGAFRPSYFAGTALPESDSAARVLGALLFRDPVLSSSGRVSCATCHQPEKSFADERVRSRSAVPGKDLERNTPSLLYAGLQQGQFYDLRAAALEDQVRNVIEHPDEMHGSLSAAAAALRRDSRYQPYFRNAFGKKDSVGEWMIPAALAAYVRSLSPFRSRFDRFLRGDDVLSQEEQLGFNLFLGKGKCGSCHFFPVFNGTVPPAYTVSESEVIGVPRAAEGTEVDPDPGRYRIHPLDPWKHSFKTPTVRNSARTAPYMHNGVFRTLEEVIRFYDDGGAAGRGILLDNQTLPPEPLHLTDLEKAALVAFLRTLSEE